MLRLMFAMSFILFLTACTTPTQHKPSLGSFGPNSHPQPTQSSKAAETAARL